MRHETTNKDRIIVHTSAHAYCDNTSNLVIQIMPVIYTADDILEYGLEIVGFAIHRQEQVCRKTQLERFASHYGSKPVVYSEMWEDFQTTPIEAARIQRKDLNLDYFLMALTFLKCYPTESQLAGTFKVSEKTARSWVRFYVHKIQALKPQKVCISMDVRFLDRKIAAHLNISYWLHHSRFTSQKILLANRSIISFVQ